MLGVRRLGTLRNLWVRVNLMIQWSVRVDPKDRKVTTHGVSALGLCDFSVQVKSDDLLSEAESFVRHLVEYQLQAGTSILPNQTVAHGYWTTKFVPRHQGHMDVWEVKSEKESHLFVLGVERCLRYWAEQKQLCSSVGASFAPPHASDFAAVSKGVLEGGMLLEGVRYPARHGQSGWYLTTDLYNGDSSTLKVMHLEHVTAARPDLIALIGLPFGYRFEVSPEGQAIWYDPEVGNAELV